MLSALARVIVLGFLGKTLYSHRASPHPEYKWVLVNLRLEVTLQWTSIPSKGE